MKLSVQSGARMEDALPDRELRVLIDARRLKGTGIGAYTDNLISGLIKTAPVNLSVILSSADAAKASSCSYPWLDQVEVIEDDTRGYSVEEYLKFAKRFSNDRYDLFHTPHYILPFGFRCPTVITVHDLIHVKHPQKWYYPLFATPLMRSALNRASKIICVSEATRQDVQAMARSRAAVMKKVSVIPNAIDPSYLDANLKGDYLNKRFQLNGKYLLTVTSMLKPHKGLRDLLKAYKEVQENGEVSCSYNLVLVGMGTVDLVERTRMLNEVGDIPGVRVLGRVSDEDLRNLYAGCAGLVVPSLAEGFCLPALAAKAFDKPVIARPVPAVLELLEEGRDVVCSDFSTGALRDGIIDFLEGCSDQAIPRIAQRDSEWLSRFTIEATAEKVYAVYKSAAGGEE